MMPIAAGILMLLGILLVTGGINLKRHLNEIEIPDNGCYCSNEKGSDIPVPVSSTVTAKIIPEGFPPFEKLVARIQKI